MLTCRLQLSIEATVQYVFTVECAYTLVLTWKCWSAVVSIRLQLSIANVMSISLIDLLTWGSQLVGGGSWACWWGGCSWERRPAWPHSEPDPPLGTMAPHRSRTSGWPGGTNLYKSINHSGRRVGIYLLSHVVLPKPCQQSFIGIIWMENLTQHCTIAWTFDENYGVFC
jgi:hypothetical protein